MRLPWGASSVWRFPPMAGMPCPAARITRYGSGACPIPHSRRGNRYVIPKPSTDYGISTPTPKTRLTGDGGNRPPGSDSRGAKKHGSVLQDPEEMGNEMANRTTLLLIGACLSVTLGWLTSTLQAQQPNLPPFSPDQQPIIPRSYPPSPPPFWLELLKNHTHLASHLVAAAVLLAAAAVLLPIWILVQLVRGILWLIGDFDSGGQGRYEGVQDKRGASPPRG